LLNLKLEISKSQQEFDGFHKLRETDPERYAELVEKAQRYEIDIDQQQYETILDMINDEEKLLSLVEMKIIYAFKSLEINIKNLLRAAFTLQSTKDFYKWDNLIKFLKRQKHRCKIIKKLF
jgi:predicted patatin/cPLA2 family phospholipase